MLVQASLTWYNVIKIFAGYLELTFSPSTTASLYAAALILGVSTGSSTYFFTFWPPVR